MRAFLFGIILVVAASAHAQRAAQEVKLGDRVSVDGGRVIENPDSRFKIPARVEVTTGTLPRFDEITTEGQRYLSQGRDAYRAKLRRVGATSDTLADALLIDDARIEIQERINRLLERVAEMERVLNALHPPPVGKEEETPRP